MKKTIFRNFAAMVLHPYLFAVLPIISLYHDNINLTSLPVLVRPVLVSLLIALVLVLFFRLVFKSGIKGGLVASALLCFVYYFAPLRVLTYRAVPVSDILFFACWIVFFSGFLLLVAFAKKTWQRTNLFLNLVTVLSLLFLSISIGRFEWAQRRILIPRFPGDLAPLASPAGPPGKEARPDIYYIILDAYGRDDTLKSVYRLDNDGFLNFLREKGFSVARDARANYNQTLFSLASSLNMRYVDTLAGTLGADSRNRRPLMRMIGDSDLARFLKKNGYAIVAFDSVYSSTRMRNADLGKSAALNLNDFEIMLLNGTLLRPHFNALLYRAHITQVLYSLDELGKLDPALTPKFVFAHIMCPHPPFVFSADGGTRIPEEPFSYNDGNHYVRGLRTYLAYLNGYKQQVQFVNKKLAALVDAILKNSKTRPVIILQGDHGPGSRLTQDSMQNTDLHERLAILDAIYLPGAAHPALPGRTSPVNTFRFILNACFGARLPLLDDRSYFVKWYQPYLPARIEEKRLSRPDAPPPAK
jgi:hypothetical protein